jgi:SAM-dependent methyltransferase
MTWFASADAYDRHVGRYTSALARELIRVAGVRRGDRALDVGCGPGALAVELAAVVGEANVAAVDPSEPFVQACQARLPAAEVRAAAAEELPFADAALDAVLAQLVVNFMSDAPAGVGEMRRVARPGGAVAACVWDYADGMTMLRTFWDAARALDPSAPDEGTDMEYCREGELRELWESVGLADVEDGQLVVVADYEDFDDYWWPFTVGVAPSGAYCAALEPDRQAALREEVRRRLGEPSGPFRLTARAWYAVGRA